MSLFSKLYETIICRSGSVCVWPIGHIRVVNAKCIEGAWLNITVACTRVIRLFTAEYIVFQQRIFSLTESHCVNVQVADQVPNH